VRRLLIFCITCASIALQCQNLPKPLTHVEACKRFSGSIVQIDSDTMRGTGFIVDPNGWVLTAFHVIANRETLVPYEHLRVTISGVRSPINAEIVSPLDKLASIRDFAILKIDRNQLPNLELWAENEIDPGAEVSIIGFPLSANVPNGATVPKFCLAGTIAAQTSFQLGNLEFLHTVYFQGISIKGISGAPIISNETGKVVGIVSTKLTGIGPALDDLRKTTGSGGDIKIMNANGQFGIGGSFTAVINLLDDQLANGLGSGTGAADAANSLKQAKRTYEKQHPAR
jgi:S1-C subfamily serine protease